MLNNIFDEFNNTYGYPQLTFNRESGIQLLDLTLSEVSELQDELNTTVTPDFNVVDTTKESMDVVYITLQGLKARGVDLDGALKELHRSNMSKTVPENLLGHEIELARERYPDAEARLVEGSLFVLYSPSQEKVIKPSCYSPADLTPYVGSANKKG